MMLLVIVFAALSAVSINAQGIKFNLYWTSVRAVFRRKNRSGGSNEVAVSRGSVRHIIRLHYPFLDSFNISSIVSLLAN